MGTLTLAFVGYALLAAGAAGGGGAVSREALLLGLSGREESTATTMVIVLILVVSLLTLGLTVGVLRRREGARHAALMTFGMMGFVSLATSVPGLQAEPPRPGAPYGVLVGVLNVLVVVLLLLPSSAADVEDAEHDRARAVTRR